MGNQTSSSPLVPQVHFPHALSSRYTRARNVTLRLEPCFWSHGHTEPLEIRDVTTNLTMFRIPTTHSLQLNHTKRLLDMYNAPVATVSTLARASGTTTTITPATTNQLPSTQQPVTVETKFIDGTAHVAARASWGDNASISCEGDWSRPQNVLFWFETTTTRSCYPQTTAVARIRSDALGVDPKNNYLLEIAPGVDVALLLLICAAIDDAASAYATSRRHAFHATTAAKRRTSRMEIAQPSMRRSDAVPVPV